VMQSVSKECWWVILIRNVDSNKQFFKNFISPTSGLFFCFLSVKNNS
jgi:hypothetical protein